MKTFDKATEILRRHRTRKYHKNFITDMVSFLTSLILINTLTEVCNYIFNYNYSSQFYLQFLKTTAKYMCWWSKHVTVISLRIYSYIYIFKTTENIITPLLPQQKSIEYICCFHDVNEIVHIMNTIINILFILYYVFYR